MCPSAVSPSPDSLDPFVRCVGLCQRPTRGGKFCRPHALGPCEIRTGGGKVKVTGPRVATSGSRPPDAARCLPLVWSVAARTGRRGHEESAA